MKIMIVGPDSLSNSELVSVLSESHMEVIQCCEKNPRNILEQIVSFASDMVFMDADEIVLPLCRGISSRNLHTKVVLLVGRFGPGISIKSFLSFDCAGGLIEKQNIAPDSLLALTRAVSQEVVSFVGNMRVIFGQVTEEIAGLSPREKEVITLVIQRKGNKQIAIDLGIAEQTVKNHLHNIFDKLHIRDRIQLILHYAA